MSALLQITAEQFARMYPEDEQDFELSEGEVIPLPSPTPLDRKLARQIERNLEDCLKRKGISEIFADVDCGMSENTVRRPDLAVFIGERAGVLKLTEVPVTIPPDLAIEILSPSEKAVDVNRKVHDYLSGDVKEVWILDNNCGEIFIRTADAMRVFGREDRLESPLLPGYSQPVSAFLFKV